MAAKLTRTWSAGAVRGDVAQVVVQELLLPMALVVVLPIMWAEIVASAFAIWTSMKSHPSVSRRSSKYCRTRQL